MKSAIRSGLRTTAHCARPTYAWNSAQAPVSPFLASYKPQIPVSHAVCERDSKLLRQLFDSPQTFKEFRSHSNTTSPPEPVGLFRNRYLTSPEGFLRFADVTLKKSQKLVNRVLHASTLEEYQATVRHLDRLSDLLCRVLDVSDFVRVTHPDEKIQAAASQAWSLVYQYMNQLNTTTGLSDQLGKALDNPEVLASWSEEEQTVAHQLKQDFMKSAIHLPEESRNRFVELSQQISELGSSFVEDMAPEEYYLTLPRSSFDGLDPRLAQPYVRLGHLKLPTLSPEASVAMRTVHDEDTRKAIYYASRTASRRSVKVLETMLHLRAQLASLSGFESYGQMALRDRMMAKSPESVDQFLLSLAKNNAPLVERDIADLLQAKGQNPHALAATTLNPWDTSYYMEGIRRGMRSWSPKSDTLASYFSLGTVMQGLSRLFDMLYGIRFVPRHTLPGETWHPDVGRLDVVSDTDGHVGVLYCDLFHRDGKSPNPAHFTIRCSREFSAEELNDSANELHLKGRVGFAPKDICELANDGMHVSERGPHMQLPTIALICDFHHDHQRKDEPALLDFYQMETLFHEMGHAIHSFLARTSLQNVSGTRCATDFAELPSTLMEHFCADPTVLTLFARHYKTDKPLPYEMLAERLRVSKRFEASDRENQIILAMLDQAYHSAAPVQGTFDSTEIYHNLQQAHGKMPSDPSGTRWQGFFGHLFGYGSTYYSYLFDQVLSERIWRRVFSSGMKYGALKRENGERLKESLLKWGGSRDPWKCLSEALQDERIVDGDEKAMAIVGSWGIRKDRRRLDSTLLSEG